MSDVKKNEAAAAGSDKPAVRFRDVVKRYGGVYAVKDMSFTVGQGEFVTLLGPSGSGKSTILNMIAGVTDPDQGELTFGDTDVTRIPLHKRNIGMVFQRYTLFPNKTVRENIAYPLVVRGLPGEEVNRLVNEMLALVGLEAQADRYPSEISGGQAQRVAVARAVVFKPALLLMDEPLGALDKALRELLQVEIRRIQRQMRVPALYVTHDQEEAMNMSDRIIVLRNGEIVANGSPRELYALPPSVWVAGFLGAANVIELAGWDADDNGGAVARTASGAQFRARVHPSAAQASKVAAIVRPEDCRVSTTAEAGRVALEAKLASVTFLGSHQRLELRLANGEKLVASVPGRMELGPEGSTLFVGWDDHCASITAG